MFLLYLPRQVRVTFITDREKQIFPCLGIKTLSFELIAGTGEAEASVERAEGRAATAEAGHVRVHRGHGQVVRAAPTETEAFSPGTYRVSSVGSSTQLCFFIVDIALNIFCRLHRRNFFFFSTVLNRIVELIRNTAIILCSKNGNLNFTPPPPPPPHSHPPPLFSCLSNLCPPHIRSSFTVPYSPVLSLPLAAFFLFFLSFFSFCLYFSLSCPLSSSLLFIKGGERMLPVRYEISVIFSASCLCEIAAKLV